MKKQLCGFLAVVLLLTMVLSMTGCSKEASVVGTWEGKLDMAEAINNEVVKADAEMGKYMKIDKFEITLRFIFGEDGSFKMEVDEESCDAAFQGMREPLEKGIRKYFEEMIKSAGLGDMTIDEALAATGMSLDSLIDEVMKSMDTSDFVDSMTQECKYRLDGDKLYTYEGVVDKDVYTLVELDGDTLTLKESHGDDETAEMMASILPCTMKKVG